MGRRWRWALLGLALLAFLVVVYVRTHPLVFIKTHAHCIKYAGIHFHHYAAQHQGRFPSHPKGYANALLLMDEDCFHALTGPGYDAAPLREAKRSGRDLAEEECGRVYVQGLTVSSNPRIAMLFDKLPTPGGDHCSTVLGRLLSPLTREVCYVDGSMGIVRERDWPEFARSQVDLLVNEGFDRQEAERLFASKPRRP
jgi:hypothetical protein